MWLSLRVFGHLRWLASRVHVGTQSRITFDLLCKTPHQGKSQSIINCSTLTITNIISLWFNNSTFQLDLWGSDFDIREKLECTRFVKYLNTNIRIHFRYSSTCFKYSNENIVYYCILNIFQKVYLFCEIEYLF